MKTLLTVAILALGIFAEISGGASAGNDGDYKAPTLADDGVAILHPVIFCKDRAVMEWLWNAPSAIDSSAAGRIVAMIQLNAGCGFLPVNTWMPVTEMNPVITTIKYRGHLVHAFTPFLAQAQEIEQPR